MGEWYIKQSHIYVLSVVVDPCPMDISISGTWIYLASTAYKMNIDSSQNPGPHKKPGHATYFGWACMLIVIVIVPRTLQSLHPIAMPISPR